MIVDLPDWGHIKVTGPDTVRFLQGLTTANIAALTPGGHTWGAMLNPKGRVLSVIEATRPASGEADLVFIHCEPALADKTQALLERYAVMDDVVFERVSSPAHKDWPEPGTAPGSWATWDAPLLMVAPPGHAATPAEVEIARVEAGMLRWDLDVDEDCFPFETPLVRYLDYGKGCYIGQEPVFRVYSQGNAARTLKALIVEGDGPVAPATLVRHADKDKAGTVTSSVVSPRHGVVALAYLHRTVWTAGGQVEVAGRRAVIRDLPL